MYALFATLTLTASPALANSSGRTGSSTRGCAGCHGSSPDTTTSAVFTAASTEVEVGEALAVTFTVGSSGSSRTGAGYNVSATGGTLAAGAGSRASGGELTQSATASMSGGSADFDFTWTAPTTPGTYTLRGVGNAVNENRSASGDGWVLATDFTITVVCADDDGDGVSSCDGDCDDSDATVSPAASELCDGVDNDCDGAIDEPDAVDAGTWYADADADGYGDASSATVACNQPSGFVADDTDCDDADGTANPAGTEVCGGGDEDCDGLTDDADSSVTGTTDWYTDTDGDGFGDGYAATSCEAPVGTAAFDSDCDDGDISIYPGAPETCSDPVDRNCDGAVGLVDGDGDGFAACDECDDGDAAVNPDAVEACNAVDDDCDGTIDEPDAVDATAWPVDADGDGFGHPTDTVVACAVPDGATDGPSTDCDDLDPAVNPDAREICNATDDDCDGSVDGPGSIDATAWPVDADGDGFAHPEDVIVDCEQPSGTVAEAGEPDCDDDDDAANPGAAEVWYDGVDQDCDGNDTDQDGDGAAFEADCDDTDPDRTDDCPEPSRDGPSGDSAAADGTDDKSGCSAVPVPTGALVLGLAALAAVSRRRAGSGSSDRARTPPRA